MISLPNHNTPTLPTAPKSIQKGHAVKDVLNITAITYLARNIQIVYPKFKFLPFIQQCLEKLEDMTLMQRANHIAHTLHKTLPLNYSETIKILISTLTPPELEVGSFGLDKLFYLPHSCYIANYGISDKFNNGKDPFEISMEAQYQLTQRSSAEFSIRPFIISQQKRTLKKIFQWVNDPNPHVRRLCSEGTRPKLPWGQNIPSFIKDPTPILPILEKLKNDSSLYVRRSVANNLGDIGKNHDNLLFNICHHWLKDATHDIKWIIRHAVRYYAKKENPKALELRKLAK